MTRLAALWIFVAATVATTASTNAQFNGVQVNVNAMGNDILGDAANEPSIAVDANDPNRMAIGWRQFDTISSSFRQAGVAFTTDGGQTWTASTLDPGQFRSDPVLDYDVDGNFYYSSLSAIDSIEFFKSTDGGATWSNPVSAFGGDKQWIAIDRTDGIGQGNIYQHWNVQFTGNPGTNFTRSIDGAATFQTAQAGPQPFMKWGTMDVGPDGTLYLAGAELDSNDGHLFSKSTNAQDPGQTPTFSTSQSVNLGGVTSVFGGVNPSGLLGQVSIATDHSFTDNRGNVYMMGSVDPSGSDPLDVMFIRSEDGGDTWSAPVRINDDSAGSDSYQWFGTMSVAPNGRIDVIWNDTRNDALDETSELYYSYSFDGGVTWAENQALSDSYDHSLGYPQQEKLGDYYDMVSDNSNVYVAYAATFTGGQDVYFRNIEAVIPCDFDDNRICDTNDIDAMFQEGPISGGVAVTPGVNDEFDLNSDGVINNADRDEWLAFAGNQNGLESPYKLGDANLDGVVDGVDFAIWNDDKFSATLLWSDGNFNGDGFNDGVDFLAWNNNKFTTSDLNAVPEPGSAVLALFGLLLLRRMSTMGTPARLQHQH